MQLLEPLYYGRSLAVMPPGLKQIIDDAFRKGVAPDLNDQQDALFTEICGIAPGLVEAYATSAARDARLGLCLPHVEFIPATYDELASAGLTACHVAVGHCIGEAGFAIVLGAIAGDIAADFVESGERTMEIVVGRMRYCIDRTGHVICGIPVYGGRPSDVELQATAAGLQREFGPRLNPDNWPDSDD